jgi:hypothetical protein
MSKGNVKSHLASQVHQPLSKCFEKLSGEFQKLSDESSDAGQAVRFQKVADHCAAQAAHHASCADDLTDGESTEKTVTITVTPTGTTRVDTAALGSLAHFVAPSEE